MIAKMLTAGVLITAANLAPFASSTAYAGHSPWSKHGGYAQRVQFRPWSHRSRQAPAPRWRPQATSKPRVARSLDRFGSPLVGAAKAREPVVGSYAAIPRAGRIGASVGNLVHFRPNVRYAPQRGDIVTRGLGSAQPSQFRPAPQRRKPTYEQLVAATSRNSVSFPRYPAGFPLPPRDRYDAYWGGR